MRSIVVTSPPLLPHTATIPDSIPQPDAERILEAIAESAPIPSVIEWLDDGVVTFIIENH